MSKKTSVARYQRLNRPQYGRGNKRRKASRGYWWLWLLLLIACLALGYGAWRAYSVYNAPVGRHTETQYLFITKQTKLEDLQRQIQTKLQPLHPNLLQYLIDYEKLGERLRPGRYAVTTQMRAHDLVKALLEGPQSPVTIKLGALRTQGELSAKLASFLATDSASISEALLDSAFLAQVKMTPEEVRTLCLRGDYEVLWDASAKDVAELLRRHHERFWTAERKALADSLGLTPAQVVTLASIVEGESAKTDEYARIAGLYLNRLHKGIPLQSDPTVIYAVGDFEIRRVLNEHLKTPSPYNTYQVTGLPPGPIRLPSPKSIDFILKAEAHSYIYMCARETFDGYHNFATSYSEHLVNARRYQRALGPYLKARAEAKKKAEAEAKASSATTSPSATEQQPAS